MSTDNTYSITPPKFLSTVSNLIFLLPAYLAAATGTPAGLFMSVLFAGMGLASAAYHHWPENELLRELDVSAIYAVFTFLPFFATGDPDTLMIIPLGLVAAWNKLLGDHPVDSTYMVPAFWIAAAIALRNQPEALPAMALFIFAGIAWLIARKLDNNAVVAGRGMGARTIIDSKSNRRKLFFSDVMHTIYHMLAGAGFAVAIS